jgi:peptide/nickel transport system substrate-binding protein
MAVRWHVRQIDDDSTGGRRPPALRHRSRGEKQAARPRRRALVATLATLLAAATLAACAGTASTGSNKPASGGKVKPGGTVTFAATQGVPPNFILPLVSASYATQTNINDFEFLLWRPLYWMGGPGTVGVNYGESLAGAPAVAADGANTKITITLHHYLWSDGTPVTSRDVEFWINLLKANKTSWWDYAPGEFPDNIMTASYPTPSTVVLVMKGHYNPDWILNELSQIIPIPQQAWDKESATGKVGNYDLTPAGAVKVFSYLSAANKQLATYATNPLWKTVDGPWTLSAFTPSNFDATFVPNKHWSGSPKPTISKFELLTFTSDTAEYNALRSGSLTYGYVPPADEPQDAALEQQGLVVQPWVQWNINFVSYNFTNPTVGPLFKQLYFRQALQHLVNQGGLIHATLAGHGYPTNGPVPLEPASQWTSPQEKTGWYPYSPSAARALLAAHGWKLTSHGAATCARAGSGSSDCGTGISAGMPLKIQFAYTAGVESVAEQASALQTAFAAAGIQLQLKPVSLDSLFSIYFPCTPGKACPWEMIYDGGGWGFEPTYNMPELGSALATGGVSNAGGYSDPVNDANLKAVYTGGSSLSSFYNYENYLGKELPLLWMPEILLQVSAVSKNLEGWSPQQPQLNITPETWKFVSS